MPAYVVFTDNTLIAIAELLPADDAALIAIPGIGARKLEQFGPDVLDLVRGRPRMNACQNAGQKIACPRRLLRIYPRNAVPCLRQLLDEREVSHDDQRERIRCRRAPARCRWLPPRRPCRRSCRRPRTSTSPPPRPSVRGLGLYPRRKPDNLAKWPRTRSHQDPWPSFLVDTRHWSGSPTMTPARPGSR